MNNAWIPYLIDGALVLLALWTVVASWRSGFVASVFDFLGLAASFVAAFLCAGPVSQWAYSRFFREKIAAFVAERMPAGVDAMLESGEIAASLSTVKEKLMLLIDELLSALGLGGLFASSSEQAALDTIDHISASGADAASALTETVIGPAVLSVINAAAFILIFLAVLLVFRLLTHASRGINAVPVVGGLNQFLGGVFGVAKGFVLAYCAAQLLLLLVGLSKGSWQYLNSETLGQTRFAAWLTSIKLL